MPSHRASATKDAPVLYYVAHVTIEHENVATESKKLNFESYVIVVTIGAVVGGSHIMPFRQEGLPGLCVAAGLS